MTTITIKDLVKYSKYMSYLLRHKPESIGLHLDPNGWADINELIEKSARKGTQLTREIITEVVVRNDKQRFAFNDDKTKIRASQGHSISINLAYKSQKPPEILYHGTATRFIDSILKQGLKKGKRHHVHLSADPDTALNVGKRHGKPVVLTIASGQMAERGYQFYLSDNGVWLTEEVPIEFLSEIEQAQT